MFKIADSHYTDLRAVLRRRPNAFAIINGSDEFPRIQGTARFYKTHQGVVVAAEVNGLPPGEKPCGDPIFGFHIHSGGSCTGTEADPFADTGTHYNSGGCPHPYHAGDMPPLFGNDGYAFSVFLTDRFGTEEIIGKTVVIHSMPDDFTTQPAGNAGKKIACGVILAP